MKREKAIKSMVLVGAVVVMCLSGCVIDNEKGRKLEAEAKVPRAEAQRIALAKVPNGTIKSAEIEKEKGRLIWSFDISAPGTADITEVNVDARTGEIVAVEKERAAAEAKEKK